MYVFSIYVFFSMVTKRIGETRQSVKKAEKDYQNGIFFSTEEVFEKYKKNSRNATDLLL